jgi:threonine dehydratase
MRGAPHAPALPVDLPMVLEAAQRIRHAVRETALAPLLSLSQRLGLEVLGKLECHQVTGSFKARGALNRILTLDEPERRRGVWTASAGNHAQGVAWAAARAGCKASVVMGRSSSPLKQAKARRLGAEVILHGEDYDDAEAHAQREAEARGCFFLHAFEDPRVIAGQGTLALELAGQCPRLGSLVVPVGGGGLLAGCAVAARALYPSARIVGVQSDASPAMVRSLEAGEPVDTPVHESIADGLSGRWCGRTTLGIVAALCDGVHAVPEPEIGRAMRWLLEEEGLLVEPSGAVPVAALLAGTLPDLPPPVVLVLSGGNVHPDVLRRVLGPA